MDIRIAKHTHVFESFKNENCEGRALFNLMHEIPRDAQIITRCRPRFPFIDEEQVHFEQGLDSTIERGDITSP